MKKGKELLAVGNVSGMVAKEVERVLAMAKKYSFSIDEVAQVASVIRDYRATVHTIVRFRDRGFSLDEIGLLYRVRDNIRESGSGEVSLNLVARVHRHFTDCLLDEDILSEKIQNAHNSISAFFMGTSLDWAIRVSEDLGFDTLDSVVEYFESKGTMPWKLIEHEDVEDN